jgi:hypothetical protein
LGWQYRFDGSGLHEAEPIPDFCSRSVGARGICEPDVEGLPHALVTEYRPGAAIGWHRDRSVFGVTVGISLLSACRFRFRRKDGNGWQRPVSSPSPVGLSARRGSRDAWEHSTAVEALRYSITFRTLAQPRSRTRRSAVEDVRADLGDAVQIVPPQRRDVVGMVPENVPRYSLASRSCAMRAIATALRHESEERCAPGTAVDDEGELGAPA